MGSESPNPHGSNDYKITRPAKAYLITGNILAQKRLN